MEQHKLFYGAGEQRIWSATSKSLQRGSVEMYDLGCNMTTKEVITLDRI